MERLHPAAASSTQPAAKSKAQKPPPSSNPGSPRKHPPPPCSCRGVPSGRPGKTSPRSRPPLRTGAASLAPACPGANIFAFDFLIQQENRNRLTRRTHNNSLPANLTSPIPHQLLTPRRPRRRSLTDRNMQLPRTLRKIESHKHFLFIRFPQKHKPRLIRQQIPLPSFAQRR